MTRGVRFAQGIQVQNVFSPKNIAGLTTNTWHVDMRSANWLSFLISIGVTSSATSADLEIGVACSTAVTSATAVPTLIPFTYRLSSTVGSSAYVWSDPTTGSSDGSVACSTGQDAVSIWIDVDPSEMAKVGAEYRWAHLLMTTSAAEMTATVVAFVEPRYAGNDIPGTT